MKNYSQTPKAQEKQKVSTLEIHNEIPSPTFYAIIICFKLKINHLRNKLTTIETECG